MRHKVWPVLLALCAALGPLPAAVHAQAYETQEGASVKFSCYVNDKEVSDPGEVELTYGDTLEITVPPDDPFLSSLLGSQFASPKLSLEWTSPEGGPQTLVDADLETGKLVYFSCAPAGEYRLLPDETPCILTVVCRGESFDEGSDLDNRAELGTVKLKLCRAELKASAVFDYGEHAQGGSVLQFSLDGVLNHDTGAAITACLDTASLDNPSALDPLDPDQVTLSAKTVFKPSDWYTVSGAVTVRPPDIAANVTVPAGSAQTVTFDFAEMLEAMPEAALTHAAVFGTGGGVLTGSPTVSGTAVTFGVCGTARAGECGTVTLNGSRGSGQPFTAALTVTAAERKAAGLSFSGSVPSSAVCGDAFRLTARAGAGDVGAGTWTWTSSDPDVLEVTGGGSTGASDAAVVTAKRASEPPVTITAGFTSSTHTGQVSTGGISVSRAVPTGAPKYTAVTKAGRTLDGAALVTEVRGPGDGFSVPGTVRWVAEDGETALPGDTVVLANTAYRWRFTPSDTGRYEPLDGSVVLFPAAPPSEPGGDDPGSGKPDSGSNPGGSGGGSSNSSGSNGSSDSGGVTGSRTETVQGPDGSSTETRTEVTANQDGSTVTATTTTRTEADGAVTTVTSQTVTAKDGSTTTTASSSDGVSVTLAADPAGAVTRAEAVVSQEAARRAARTGETLTVPIRVEAAKSAGEAPAVKLDVPAAGDGVRVELPVENLTHGTVAVMVDALGRETVLPKTAVTGHGLALTVRGGLTVKVVDNGKDFRDVPRDSWASGAVDFVSSRELFSGTGKEIFSPGLSMTRGMLAQVLYNLESRPDSAVGSGFADVDAGDWYGPAVQWASDRGLVSGYGDGRFGAGDAITREQLAVILYNYAGRPETSGALTGYLDAARASGYARDALRWAVERGILSGKGGGVLDPGGNATRAQVAQMLENFVNQLCLPPACAGGYCFTV